MTRQYLLRVQEYVWDPVAKSTRQRQVITAIIDEAKLALAMTALREAGIELRGHDGNIKKTCDKHCNGWPPTPSDS